MRFSRFEWHVTLIPNLTQYSSPRSRMTDMKTTDSKRSDEVCATTACLPCPEVWDCGDVFPLLLRLAKRCDILGDKGIVKRSPGNWAAELPEEG